MMLLVLDTIQTVDASTVLTLVLNVAAKFCGLWELNNDDVEVDCTWDI
jgi:hypothetical protein